jgi:hypothetical protein
VEIQEAVEKIEKHLADKGVTAVVEASGGDLIKILMNIVPCKGRPIVASLYFELGIPFMIQAEYSPEGLPCPFAAQAQERT